MDTRRTTLSRPEKYRRETVARPECVKTVPRKFSRYGISADDFVEALKAAAPFDFVFITSVMSYWYPGVYEAIRISKELFPVVPVVLGGIYATLWNSHASACSGADFIHSGPLSGNLGFIFRTFGYRMKKKNQTETPYYRQGLYPNHPFAPLLTGTGCPYRCSYCASALLSDTFSRRSIDEVAGEIKDLYELGVRDFAFYDDALLVNPDSHIKPILKRVIDIAPGIRFHCPNGLHARFIDDELAGLMRRSGFQTLKLSLETVDAGRQKDTGGKVSADDVSRAVEALKKHGFTKDHIGVYLMFGLPGQDIREIREGVRFLKGLDVRINLNEFSPIPATSCWKELLLSGIISEDIDPLQTNNTVFSWLYSGFDPEETKKPVASHKNLHEKIIVASCKNLFKRHVSLS